MKQAKQIVFSPFRLDIINQRLYCGKEALPLRPKTFAVLAYLPERCGQLVSKEELLDACWPETNVSDLGLKLEAESCFRQAIAVAQMQRAKSWELRATMSLAWLYQSRGEKEEARQRLAKIYGWFTEGFDTADLRETKALLDEL